jgi:hypothetical protein
MSVETEATPNAETTVTGAANTLAALKSTLENSGLQLSEEGEQALTRILQDKIRLAPGRPPMYETCWGPTADLGEYLASLADSPLTSRFFTSAKTATWNQPASNPLADATTKDEAAGNPANPWLEGPNFNRTRQALLTNKQPELAARLKAEAAAANARKSGLGDPSNPFSKAGWNLTQQMILTKRDPATAARLRAAAGVS